MSAWQEGLNLNAIEVFFHWSGFANWKCNQIFSLGLHLCQNESFQLQK